LALALGLGLGLLRGGQYMALTDQYNKLHSQPVVVVAQASSDAIYGYNSQLDFEVTQVQVLQPQTLHLAGKIKVDGFGAPMVYRGNTVQLTGRLRPTRGSAQAKMSYAKIKLIDKHISSIDRLRQKFIAGLESALPEPAASFGAGLLIGQRSTIPPAVNDQLSTTGLTHLVAVSGYNLTIIIVAVRRLLGRRSKYQSTVAAVSLMILFILVTGLSASIIRAAMVSSLSLLAWYYGRKFKPLLLITLTAAATAWWNPFYLWADIGWYLSYLAFFGLLVIAPLLDSLIGRFTKPNQLLMLLAETTSAQIMTLPIIMYIFGRLSLISLVSNLMVVPLVPLAMLGSLAAGLAGSLLGGLAGWLSWPARFLTTYMLDVVGLLSSLPHAAVQRTISSDSMVALYILIILGIVVLRHHAGPKKLSEYATITE
jgi:competence protein ComEC